jgi:hypothetical protein
MGILLTGNILEESLQQLVEAYKHITALGLETGLPFSIEKTEIQHFSRKQQQYLPIVTLPGIREITPSLYTRWLGVLLDMSQAMAWSLVVGYALNLVLDKVSATSVYSLGIAAS